MKRLLRRVLSIPAVARLPVHVRKGFCAGSRWSFFPCTAYWRGTHQPEVQSMLAGLWDWTGRHVWDLGAHFGFFSIGLARRVGPSGSVAAFEPNPDNFERLRLHAGRNMLPWLTLYPFAVSDQAGRFTFVIDENLGATASRLPYEGENPAAARTCLQVRTIRLDDLVAAGALSEPGFIKLDVEGHGHRALQGAAATLRRARPKVLTGLHSPHELAGIARLLGELGYRAVPVGAGLPVEPTVGGDYLWHPST